MMATDFQMPLRAYYSPEKLAAGDPDWIGTLGQFWHEHQKLDYGEVRTLADKLKSRGFAVFGADDVLPAFWLVRGGVDFTPSPKGWAVAEMSTEATDAERSPAGRTNTSYLLERAERAERLNGTLLAAIEQVAKMAWWSTNDHPYGPPPLLSDVRAKILETARAAIAKVHGSRS